MVIAFFVLPFVLRIAQRRDERVPAANKIVPGALFTPPDVRILSRLSCFSAFFCVQYDVYIKHKNVLPTGEDKSPLVSVKYAMP